MGDPPAAPKPCCVCDEPGCKHCTKCKSRHYCSKKCQLVDWNKGGHKAQCRQMATEFSDRLLDKLMPLKIKEVPAIFEDVLLLLLQDDLHGMLQQVPSTTRDARSAERQPARRMPSFCAGCRSTWTRGTPTRRCISATCTKLVAWASKRA
ncbi:hypothetical protein M885DRAFT_468543 [Pelagophyceae sp. CCMP2097]|nr:hypothetical protein M885DRAFT_468543 [Pelagophyceae sp. CCMP2097]